MIASAGPCGKMDDDVNPEALVADLKGKKKKKKPKITLEETSEQLSQLASKVEDIDISEPSHPPEPAQDEDFDALMNDLKTKKKKKKPKKMPELPLEDSGPAATDTVQPTSSEHAPAEDQDHDATELGDLELELKGVKKPKKGSKVVTISDVPLAEPSEPAEDDALANSAFLTTVDFSLPKRKKRRRPNVTFEGFDIKDIEATEGLAGDALPEEDDIHQAQRQKMPWLGSDRDYTYEELLERAFKMIMHNNPNMGGGRPKLVMKPPQVIRAGKKTSFANFPEICKTLHREPKHLMAFLMAELGTSGSIDGSNQLIIKGKFMQKQVESVLKKYIKEYVTCHTCRSPDTMLQREIRLTFLQCDNCGSKCSVQSIKSGFQAVTSSRAQLRVKQT